MADEPTKEELSERAKELDVEGRSKMDKDELAAAVEAAEKPKKSTPKKRTASRKPKGDVRDDKRADAQARLKAKRKAGDSFGLDAHDPLLGWDAQQGRVRPVLED